MCEQIALPFCSSHAKEELDAAIEDHQVKSSAPELDNGSLKKLRGRLDKAWRSFLITDEGLLDLEGLVASAETTETQQAAKARLKYYRNQRRKCLLKNELSEEDLLRCKNCNNELGKQQTLFCGSECVKESRIRSHVRTCKDCGKTPEEAEFGKHPKTVDGLSIVCKICNRKRIKASTANYSPDKLTEIDARRKSDLYKNTRLVRKFGIDVNFYNKMVSEQQNKCAICTYEFTDANLPQVDHDHITGKVRALLCRTCNMGLGVFRDDHSKLRQAIDYLRRTTEKTHIESVTQLLLKRKDEKRHDMLAVRGILTASKEGRLRLLESQDLKCACCEHDLSHRNFLKINIDHDHIGMFIRGALCKHCNVGLGLFYEDEARFTAAIGYLVKHSSAELAA